MSVTRSLNGPPRHFLWVQFIGGVKYLNVKYEWMVCKILCYFSRFWQILDIGAFRPVLHLNFLLSLRAQKRWLKKMSKKRWPTRTQVHERSARGNQKLVVYHFGCLLHIVKTAHVDFCICLHIITTQFCQGSGRGGQARVCYYNVMWFLQLSYFQRFNLYCHVDFAFSLNRI